MVTGLDPTVLHAPKPAAERGFASKLRARLRGLRGQDQTDRQDVPPPPPGAQDARHENGYAQQDRAQQDRAQQDRGINTLSSRGGAPDAASHPPVSDRRRAAEAQWARNGRPVQDAVQDAGQDPGSLGTPAAPPPLRKGDVAPQAQNAQNVLPAADFAAVQNHPPGAGQAAPSPRTGGRLPEAGSERQESAAPYRPETVVSTAGLYGAAFGLRERPFSLVPDPDFLFWTPAHRHAFTVLEYGVASRAPLTVITGEVGTGKTTLVQMLLRALPGQSRIGLVSNAQGGRGELLRWVLNALDVPHEPGADYVALFQYLQDVLLQEYAAGNHTVLIFDEAQNLSPETLEELRMLTNINSNKDELLQLILVGQPELRALIERPELRQFAQRVGASFHLNPMDPATTGKYISHRLVHAGGTGAEIAPEAVAAIHQASGGIPRLVNKICDLALIYAASAEQTRVEPGTVADVLADDLFIRTRTPSPSPDGPAEDD